MRPEKALMKTIFCTLTLLLLLGTIPALAADGNAALSGVVSDPTGAVVPQATVILRNSTPSAEVKSSTREDGSFTFPSIPPGLYDLRIASPGFKSYSTKALQLAPAETSKLDATLALAEQSTVVEVSAEAPQLDLSSTQIGENLTGTQMRSVPVN